MHNGIRHNLKGNGLPDGYALYWFYPEGKPKSLEAQLATTNKYVYTMFQGKAQSCRTQDWKKGVDFVLALRAQAKEQGAGVKPTDLTIKQLLDHYVAYLEKRNTKCGDYKPKTAQITRSTVNGWLSFFAKFKADKLTHMPEKQVAYREKRTEELMLKMGKPAIEVQYTIDHELTILRAAYNRAVKDNMIHRSIVPVFNIDKKNSRLGIRDNMFTSDEIGILLEQLPEPINFMLAFDISEGVRKKESCFIHRDRIDWTERLVTLNAQETKAQEKRIVSIPKKLMPMFLAWEEKTKHEHKRADYFFHFDGKRMTEAQIDRAFNDTCERLGWHKPKLDKDGNPRRGKGKNRSILYDRSPRWHDSRRNATTDGGVLEGVNDLDRQRTLGQSAETRARYDKNDSAKKMRDAKDARDAAKMQIQPAISPLVAKEEITIEDKLVRLNAMFERGLIPAHMFESKRMQILAEL
jgi:hypothetical protein